MKHGNWATDTLVTVNVNDILREAHQITKDIVTNQRVFDHGPAMEKSGKKHKGSEVPVADNRATDGSSSCASISEEDND
jgi:hypothetical protein